MRSWFYISAIKIQLKSAFTVFHAKSYSFCVTPVLPVFQKFINKNNVRATATPRQTGAYVWIQPVADIFFVHVAVPLTRQLRQQCADQKTCSRRQCQELEVRVNNLPTAITR